jgi:hypothetical protein
LIIISASSAVPETGAEGMNPAEKWVVAKIRAGDRANLGEQFLEEKDRKLSAHFLQELLTGAPLH